MVLDAIEKDVPVPTLTTALFTRFRSRQEESFAEKMLAALRNAFGGHASVAKIVLTSLSRLTDEYFDTPA